MTNGELSPQAIADQALAFIDYSRKPGPLDIDAWMDTKDFHPVDRERIRKAVLGLLAAEVWDEETA